MNLSRSLGIYFIWQGYFMSLRIIACGVFRDALDNIAPERFYTDVVVTYITPVLHNYPQRLKKELLHQIRLAKQQGDKILCLYGKCFPDLDRCLYGLNVPRVPGDHCYEILLGSRRFRAMIGEEAGTYFVEKELILNFFDYCIQPLELNDPSLREAYFKHYKRLAYIRQPADSGSVMSRFHDISQFLNLVQTVTDVDYTALKNHLLEFFSIVKRE